jgi:hypothetical protein
MCSRITNLATHHDEHDFVNWFNGSIFGALQNDRTNFDRKAEPNEKNVQFQSRIPFEISNKNVLHGSKQEIKLFYYIEEAVCRVLRTDIDWYDVSRWCFNWKADNLEWWWCNVEHCKEK